MPCGLKIEEAKEIELSVPSLMASLNRAKYKISFTGLKEEELAEACHKLLAKEEFEVLRLSPKGDKMVDIRRGILSLRAEGNKVFALCKLGSKGSPKPKELAESIVSFFAGGKVEEILRTELFCQEIKEV